MQRSLFLVYALLLTVTGALDSDDSKSVSAVAGGAVLLPCHTDDSHDKLTVEWSKEGPPEVTVFLLRKGCENHEEKNPAYEFRTNLIMSELKNGNISLRISNVQLSDEGRYICKTIKGSSNGPQREGVILLTVVAASEPKLSVVPDGGGGVTLQCDAGCWFPKPEITFLDDHGNKISVDDPKEEFNYGGCFNITRRATLPTAVNRKTYIDIVSSQSRLLGQPAQHEESRRDSHTRWLHEVLHCARHHRCICASDGSLCSMPRLLLQESSCRVSKRAYFAATFQ
ncbi:selection and upkeep of intraepithelial T-cells protein 7-like isoform X3 [Notolabrus celidotus]|uniref:selection and upkeep of intraepithelial T-cells protein 7-like isoform X3 n=1 Tax=Notolabrus celidotus TaxID=1203425 RepID=UPI00148FDF77|nr:selection and upkeep of intraepithelial T-cells protein 7-like isoform X3 [Notolabrus celidotus]